MFWRNLVKSFYYLLLLIIIFGCNSGNNEQIGINPLPNLDALWDYQHPDSTEIVFKEILNGLHSSTESSYDAEYHVELLTQIARAQGLQGEFKEAHATLDSAKIMLTDNMKIGHIRYLLERGRIFNVSGEWEISKPLFLKAYEFGTENGLDFYTIDAIHMIGIVEPPEKQLDWNLKALQIAEETSDKSCEGWLGPLYNNIGWTYHDQGNYNEALQYFQKGYDWRIEVGDQPGARIAKWTIGRCYRSLKRYKEALEIQNELRADIEEKDLPKDGYVFEELAELYLIEGDSELAAENFGLAYQELSKDRWIVNNQPERLNRLKKLSSR